MVTIFICNLSSLLVFKMDVIGSSPGDHECLRVLTFLQGQVVRNSVVTFITAGVFPHRVANVSFFFILQDPIELEPR